MTGKQRIKKAKLLSAELAHICQELRDEQIQEVFGDGTVEELLTSILDPRKVEDFPTFAEFFLANKARASLLAGIRLAITRSYSFKGQSKEGVAGYASPSHVQWFDDGVVVLEGTKPFEGLIAVYRGGQITYAVAARDFEAGEELGPDDFLFVDPEDTKFKTNQPDQHDLDQPVQRLCGLLFAKKKEESKYQQSVV